MRTLLICCTVASVALGTAALPAQAQDKHTTVTPKDLKWGPAPPIIPAGARLAVLSGNPTAEGPFIMRLQLPPNYKLAPHSHSKTEDVTVISGTLTMGMGDKIDVKAGKALGPGGFSHLPGGMTHYAIAGGKGSTVQVSGMGPFDIKYVNPADDPNRQAKR
jgi:ChrR Cupin-like domain